MDNFKNWLSLDEGRIGYVVASICGSISLHSESINEARANPEKLRNREIGAAGKQMRIFGDKEPEIEVPKKHIVGPDNCPINPLSGYKKHIEAIQKYARQSPDNLAQVMMFSPLSANVPFQKHWDNFQVLMMILKHYFPKKVDIEQLRGVVDGFGDYLHSMAHTIASFKFDTISQIWNNREALFQELPKLADEGDDEKLIARLTQISGIAPVKAGFIVQLLYGRAGCIDTHNIDIYSKVFPDMANRFTDANWKNDPESIKRYVKLLHDLDKQKGIGTQQLWDVWVDFVENFYLITSGHGKGLYANMGSALDPNDPVYQAFQNIKIPKQRVGKSEKDVDVPLVSGKHGMGASATHLMSHPDDMLKQFQGMYDRGEPGNDAASSVPFHVDKYGKPLDTAAGMGTQPSLLHYFRPAIGKTGDVDHDHIKRIIDDRLAKGGKKARKLRGDAQQGSLF